MNDAANDKHHDDSWLGPDRTSRKAIVPKRPPILDPRADENEDTPLEDWNNWTEPEADDPERSVLQPALPFEQLPSFRARIDIRDVFENEAAIEASINKNPDAQAWLAEYLGYNLAPFESQVPVLPGTKLAVDFAARRPNEDAVSAVFELTQTPLDSSHAHKTVSYAKFLGAEDAVLIAPSFPEGTRALVEALQHEDNDGIKYHMVQLEVFKLHDQADYHFSFLPLEVRKTPNQALQDLQGIIRRAHKLQDDSLSRQSIQVDINGRVRVESWKGLGAHSFIRISSTRTHARISVIVKEPELKKEVERHWPHAFLDRVFSTVIGYERSALQSQATVVAGYNFRINNPENRTEYYSAVASAYIEIRSALSHLLAITGQVTSQRIIPFTAPAGTPQLTLPKNQQRGG